MADNPILNVSGDELSRLETVLGLAGEREAIGWAIDKNRLVFFKYSHPKMTPLPGPADMTRCAQLAMDWLSSGAVYPREPDIDGDVGKGWRCYCEDWGHVADFHAAAFVAIEPYWMMFGK